MNFEEGRKPRGKLVTPVLLILIVAGLVAAGIYLRPRL